MKKELQHYKIKQLIYSIATNITTVNNSCYQLTTPAINATSFTTDGNIETTGGTITAFGDITSSGTMGSGTMKANNIDTYTGSTMNIANACTSINIGSSTLGNTIYIGNLLSTIYLNGDVHISSNNPFDFFNQTIRQF